MRKRRGQKPFFSSSYRGDLGGKKEALFNHSKKREKNGDLIANSFLVVEEREIPHDLWKKRGASMYLFPDKKRGRGGKGDLAILTQPCQGERERNKKKAEFVFRIGLGSVFIRKGRKGKLGQPCRFFPTTEAG